MMIALALSLFAGCATVPNRPARPAKSSYGCMKAVVEQKVPSDIPDKRAHCLAAGLIARYCSRAEAHMASAGKELRDLVGSGEPEWSDYRADRTGMDCARFAEDDESLAACCEQHGY